MLSQSPFRLAKSQHRLETVSLSQALHSLPPKNTTGLSGLDAVLDGGISRGQILEVYGCPGSGKTTFGMHIAARVVKQGQKVTWLECSQVLPASRLKEFLESSDSLRDEEYNSSDDRHDDEEDDDERKSRQVINQLNAVTCLTTLTLSSLLSLLLHSKTAEQRSTFVTSDTALLVIDDLTTIYNAAFPPDNHKDTATKKQRVLSILADALTRLAITENISVLILSKLTSKITKGGPAQLESPFGDLWSTHCSTRLVLFRDFYAKKLSILDDDEIRWIAVQKVASRNILEPASIPIKIVGSGIVQIDLEASQMARSQSQSSRPSSRQSTETIATPIREPPSRSRLRSDTTELVGERDKRARMNFPEQSSPGTEEEPEIEEFEEEKDDEKQDQERDQESQEEGKQQGLLRG